MVVYEGQPGVECTAKSPEVLVSGMNRFLKHLAIMEDCCVCVKRSLSFERSL